jgi:hypothetical protein
VADSDTKLARLFLPSNGGIFFVLLLGLFLFERPLDLLTDGGTARHILTGQYILEHGHLPTANYITRLFANTPWQTNSFIADTIYGAFYNLLGYNGIVLSAAFAIALALTWSYQIARARGMSATLGMVLAIVVMFVMSLHWSARPHLFTYLAFLIEYYIIFVWPTSNRNRLIGIAVIQLIWVNLHGSYYLGLGMVICKFLGDLLAPPYVYAEPAERRLNTLWALGFLATAIGVSCINASGGANFLNIGPYMHVVTTTIKNDEWRSIDFAMGIRVWLFLLLALLQFAIWTYSPRKPVLSEFMFSCGIFLFGLYSMRIIPYFALLMPIGCAASLDALLPTIINDNFLKLDAKISAAEPASIKTGLVWSGIAAAMVALWLASPAFAVRDFDPNWLPVQCVQKLKTYPPNSYGFTRDNWASYAYLNSHLPVFMDDYHNYYPDETLQEYRTIFYAEDGWKALIDKNKFDWILVPANMPLQVQLRQTPGWKLVCADKSGALFEKSLPGNGSAE